MSESSDKLSTGDGCGCATVILLGLILYTLSWGFEHIIKHLHAIEGLMHR